ncbi:hypothetical protein P7C70_g6106, partial [Phenoliferia sp. Uapishka_3]
MLPWGKEGAIFLSSPPDALIPTSPTRARSALFLIPVALLLLAQWSFPHLLPTSPVSPLVQEAFAKSLAKCAALHDLPGIPTDFYERTESDRYDTGTNDVLIKNATIWTGNNDGKEVVTGNVWIQRGIIKHVAGEGGALPKKFGSKTITIDAHGAFLSPGLFDLHSHLGVESYPLLAPYLHSVDGFNGHDESFKLTVAGGVTSSIILPGSANQMGGQAFAFKLRPTNDNSPRSKLLEAPFDLAGLNRTRKEGEPLRWRSMKMACGENPRRVFGMTRMDEGWETRSSFEKAAKIKMEQDEFCERVLTASNKKTVINEKFPDDPECPHLTSDTPYTPVPNILKSAYNNTPAVAIFAVFAGYKREVYYSSVFAAKVLHEQGIRVILKSDGPTAVFPRHLVFEAAQVHYWGLPAHVALSSVTSTPATVAGYGHRVGFVRPGYDADIVLWDSHPLSLGATPQQVIIDGILQLPLREISGPSSPLSLFPPTPPTHSPAAIASTLSPDHPSPSTRNHSSSAIFINITEIYLLDGKGLMHLRSETSSLSMVVKNGKTSCFGNCVLSEAELQFAIDLKRGTILPPLISFGPPLGLEVFEGEPSTSDGAISANALTDLKKVVAGGVARAADGISFGDKHVDLARKAGVAIAVVSPVGSGLLKGLAVAFKTSAKHGMEKGAIVKEVVGLHLSISRASKGSPSITTQINTLRQLLLSPPEVSGPNYFDLAATGALPLIISVHKADDIASLLRLKSQVETSRASSVKLVITGASEAWLLADELAAANVGVILSPLRAPPASWSALRSHPGPPFENSTSLTILHRAGVKVGINVQEEFLSQTQQLSLEMGWALKSSQGQLSRGEIVQLATTNLASMLGLHRWTMSEEDNVASESEKAEFLAYEGDALNGFEAKLVASASPVGEGGVEHFL